MKKFLLLTFLGLGLAFAMPQNAGAQVYTLAQSGDTVTNAETEYLTISVKQSYSVLSFQYVAVKLSGTVAGTATLQASLDNSNWVNLDTLTNTDVATQTFFSFVTPNKYYYYRFKCTGTDTMAARVYVYMVAKQD
jgi:hypothetical protein